ncbi:hypothetical protein M8J76_015244 [Diaphorina citri]|nr:hypothetical protein M8J76_015244 [Diaphorina citri]
MITSQSWIEGTEPGYASVVEKDPHFPTFSNRQSFIVFIPYTSFFLNSLISQEKRRHACNPNAISISSLLDQQSAVLNMLIGIDTSLCRREHVSDKRHQQLCVLLSILELEISK